MIKLRTQLILAFLLLAVVPLGGVTLYSYLTSVDAFKKAAEAEAMEFSSELERRFQRLARVINEEVENVLRIHYEELVNSNEGQLAPETEQAMSRFYRDIGNLTPYIRSLEIAVPEREGEETDTDSESNRVPGPRRPSSMIMSFADRNEAAAERQGSPDETTGTGIPSESRPSGRSFIMRDRPGYGPPSERAGNDSPPELPEAPPRGDTREFIRELVFNRLNGGRNPETIPPGTRANGNQGPAIPELFTPPVNPEVPETSFITRARELNFDAPLSIGDTGTLLKANINGPLLLREVMQATMREGDIPFVLDRERKVITTDENHLDLINSLPLEAGTYTRIEESTGEWMVSARQVPRSGRTIGILRPLSGELQAIKKTALINSSFGIAACILAILAIYPLSRGFTRQLGELMTGVKNLSQGDLDTRVSITTGNEFGRLAEAFNEMAVDLKQNQEEKLKHETLRRELELCREIQKGLLPGAPLKIHRAELQGISIPAREVGGDFFNYFPLPENRTALLIGDVSGKGVPAALLMANIQAKLQALLPMGKSMARMAEELDDDIFNSTLPENYLTLFAGILDYEAESLKWVNAGHNTQYLLRKDGQLEHLKSTGRPLGLLPGGGYSEVETTLEKGDTLFLFTDGLTDAEDKDGDFFGEERLEEISTREAGKPAGEILASIEKAIREHSGDTLATDDATMLILKISG